MEIRNTFFEKLKSYFVLPSTLARKHILDVVDDFIAMLGWIHDFLHLLWTWHSSETFRVATEVNRPNRFFEGFPSFPVKATSYVVNFGGPHGVTN